MPRMASWYVDPARVAVDFDTAVVDGHATVTIYRIEVVDPGWTALTLTGFMDAFYAVQVGLADRHYLPGEVIVVTTHDALRVIYAGQYVGVDPHNEAAVAAMLAAGRHKTTVWAVYGAVVSDAALAAAVADQSPDPVPPVPVVPLDPTPGGGGVDAGVLLDLSSRMDALEAQLVASSEADRARVNHTGTQAAATIADLREAVQDIVAALLVAGTGVVVTYSDAADTLVISASGVTSAVHTLGGDVDGTPYFDVAGVTGGGALLLDSDGVPYFDVNAAAGVAVAADVDGTPYVDV